MPAADEMRPYRAEFGAIHHEDAPGFLFTVNPAHAADEVARAMNVAHRVANDAPASAQQAEECKDEIERLKRELAAADGRAADYRTVAINQGWNWRLCEAYGREEYAKHRGEHIDACALNAAESRARAALESEGERR